MKVLHLFLLVLIFIREVAVSTFRIAGWVMSPRLHLRPCFVEVPLDLRGEVPRFLFACLISMTPGSMTVSLDSGRDVLTVHLLNAPDPQAAVDEIKSVFERRLIRIFGSIRPSNVPAEK